jgi:integrase
MRGHIVKRAKDSSSLKISLGKDASGKYRYKWVTVRGGRKSAEKKLSELLHQLDTGEYAETGREKVADLLNRFLEEYAAPNLSPRTVEGYESVIRVHLIPALGSIRLSALTDNHMRNYYARALQSGLSARSVAHHHTLLHKALRTAIEWHLVTRNAANGVRPPRAIRREMQTWSQQEASVFLEAARETQYYEVFYLALFTGMRRSELLTLRWDDVDLVLGQIYVNRSYLVLKGGQDHYKDPKSSSGRRAIALPPSALLVLSRYRERKEAEALMLETALKEADPVFCDTSGWPLRPASVSHAWARLVKQSGLKPIRLHDARHTHASIMLKQGVHPKVVQERLGHSTLDTYSHVAPGMQERAALRFDEAFESADNRSSKLVATPESSVDM